MFRERLLTKYGLQMRGTWEKEAAADMAELKDLRDKGKKVKKELDDTKQE